MFALDIDRTVAIDRNGCARHLNRVLSLDISEATIDNLDAYYQFEDLPQVRAFRATSEALYQSALQQADYDPDVIMAIAPMECAVEAVQQLAKESQVIYVTCRRPEEADVTRAWLAHHDFPNPNAVSCCKHYYWKYLHAYAAAELHEPVIIIDDMMEQVVRSFGSVAREQPQIAYNLLKRLEVVGFDHKEFPPLPKKMPFAYSILQSWQPAHFDAWRLRTRAAASIHT